MATILADPVAWARRNAGTPFMYWGRGLLHIVFPVLAVLIVGQGGQFSRVELIVLVGVFLCGTAWPFVYLECIRRLLAELDRRSSGIDNEAV